MTCSVLGSCYEQLRKFYFPRATHSSPTAAMLRPASETFVEYDELLPAWEELGDALRDESPPLSAQRLRAFYALELVHYQLIPTLSHSAEKIDFGWLKVQVPRTQEGLGNLLTICEKLKKNIVMRRGHTELLGKQRNPAFELMAASLRSAGQRVDLCANIALALRGALNGNDKELEKVGKLFADSLSSFKVPLQKTIDYLNTMRTISIEQPLQPWNQSTRFQV